MLRRGRGLVLPLALLLSMAACDQDRENRSAPREASPAATPTRDDTLVIALVGTLSGPDSWRGEDAFEGADVAVHELNASLGEGERRFEVVSGDDEGDPERATELVEGFASEERTAGVVYAGPPEGLPPAEDALAAAEIPAFLVYGDLYGARLLSPHTFQVSPPFLWQARRLAAYLIEDRGYKTIGALVEDSLEGRTASAALQNALDETGGGRSRGVRYEPGAEDLKPSLELLRARGAEAVVVHGPPRTFALVVEQLRSMGAGYRSTAAARIASQPRRRRRAGAPRQSWSPQLGGFDPAISTAAHEAPPGTVAADTYARSATYLPVASLEAFSRAFESWWGPALPFGWERRSYEAVGLIGWAVDAAAGDEDLAAVLETLEDRRFGGLDVTFGPDDHTSVTPTTVGLWTVPGPRDRLRNQPPAELEWVPLARGFSLDGERTVVLEEDWPALFRDPPPEGAPAPRWRRMLFAVTSPRSDPIH